MIKYKIKNVDNKNNQLYVDMDNRIMFISYNTIMFIYYKDTNILEFDNNECNYTRTTCKYLTIALEELHRELKYNSIYLNNLIYKCNNRKKLILNCNIIQLNV